MSSPPPTSRTPCLSLQDRIERAIARLTSLHDSEAGFVEVVSLGPDAVPALRALLFAREPSGLYQPRCRAAEALAALRAFDVLADFLRAARPITDPVERVGNDAVMSTAGRSLARLREDWVYRLLLDLAGRRKLTGILAGLGSFQRKDSIPVFVDALGEDDVRLTAEAILRGFGKTARPALMTAALDRGDDHSESESHLRRRRSALGLLLEMGVPRKAWSRLRLLMDDGDHQIALLACQLCLVVGDDKDRARLPERFASLRATAGWLERERIDDLCEAVRRSVADT